MRKSLVVSVAAAGILAFAGLSAWAQTKTTQQPASAAEWKSVQEVFGFPGDLLPNDVIRFNMPRKDLHVTKAGVEVKPALALGAWAAFHRVGANDAMIMGDLVLTEDEVAPAINALEEGGVEVTALHNHLLGETPKIWYIHMGGHGDPVKLAQAVKHAVTLMKAPLPQGAPAPESQQLAFDVAAVDKIMDQKGKVSGGVLHFNMPRAEKLTEEGLDTPGSMGAGTSINFQPTGNRRAAIAGDFAMTGKEVGPVMKVLRDNGIEIEALHNHALNDVPRLFYMHFWANNDAVKLAKALRAALDKTDAKNG
ncbi:MAG: DUF1259 domain-containing protein [Gammaproteobacteria bacterium]|nr:DUF1259 domain-containing protein [Gammaproteobacteria bacterium]